MAEGAADVKPRWQFIASASSKVNEWTSWVRLSRLRNSFLSRAITALSLSSLVLANFPAALARAGIEPFTMQLTLIGSLLFLLGYLLFGLWVPSEFSIAGEIYDHVRRMRDLADTTFIKSRLKVSENIVARMNQWNALRPPQPLMDSLNRKVQELKGKVSNNIAISADDAAGLFHLDLSLRNHDSPLFRLTTALIMGLGVVCLAFSTGRNVVKALTIGFDS